MDEEKKPQETGGEGPKKQSKRFLVVYIIGLFSVALVLILLSYLTQVRANRQLESYKNQVSEQTSVAQGAQQQMDALQNTVQEQQKRIDEMTEAVQAIRDELGVQPEQKVEEAVAYLQDRYIALDALQQVRRLSAAGADTEAKELLQKMIDNYGLDRLEPHDTPNYSVLIGANAIEFQNFCAQYGIESTAQQQQQ